jgi:hypothetical protein
MTNGLQRTGKADQLPAWHPPLIVPDAIADRQILRRVVEPAETVT